MSVEFEVVIAGGGLAGLSAGLTVARLGRKTLVLTGDVAGGQLLSIETIEGYPGFPEGIPGYDLCPMVQEQAASAGVEFLMTALEKVSPREGGFHLQTGEGEFAARELIVATGSILKKLGIPGEDRLAGKGVSHCASCDAPLLRGRVVAVVGGGDSGLQESLTLAEFASKVVLLERSAVLNGQVSYRERVLAHPKIDVRFGAVVNEIIGGDVVAGLKILTGGAASELEVAAVFPYIGLEPNARAFAGLIDLDGTGQIPVDADGRTLHPGLGAAGNVRSYSPCRAASAAGDGTGAAIAIDRYLKDGSWREERSREAGKVAAAAR